MASNTARFFRENNPRALPTNRHRPKFPLPPPKAPGGLGTDQNETPIPSRRAHPHYTNQKPPPIFRIQNRLAIPVHLRTTRARPDPTLWISECVLRNAIHAVVEARALDPLGKCCRLGHTIGDRVRSESGFTGLVVPIARGVRDT